MSGWSPSTASRALPAGQDVSWPRPGRGSPPSWRSATTNPLSGLHRRFEVVPGAQAQVDWGDEGDPVRPRRASRRSTRSTWCCPTRGTRSAASPPAMDLATFWDCHRRAFAHFGGVPGQRSSTTAPRPSSAATSHRGVAVPLHPEAAAFADHYGFAIDVLAAYRPTGKGRVERQVAIVRDHVLAGRSFDSIAELDGAFDAVGADPPRPGPPHPRPGHRRPRRGRPGRAGAAAGAAVSGHREASAAGRQGLPDLLRGQSATRCPPAGSGPGSGSSCRSTPDPAVDRVTIHAAVDGRRRRLARHPPPRDPPRRLGRRPGPLGRAARRTHPRHHRRPSRRRPRRPRPAARSRRWSRCRRC